MRASLAWRASAETAALAFIKHEENFPTCEKQAFYGASTGPFDAEQATRGRSVMTYFMRWQGGALFRA